MALKKIDISKWDNSWLRKIRGGGTAESPPASPEEPEAPEPPPAPEEAS
jgi:hypothetical protein